MEQGAGAVLVVREGGELEEGKFEDGVIVDVAGLCT